METASCEILLLPEELLTSPPDACSAATVSCAFCTAANSDAVWSCFLPSDLPQFAEGELPHMSPPSTKKGTFLCLSDQPALLPCGLMSMRLDKFSGAKCYTLSARALHISWGDNRCYWEWIDIGCDEIQRNKRFSQVAKLLGVCWLEIRGKINSRILTQNSMYAAYMVFKLDTDRFYDLDDPFQEASVSVGGSDESTRQVGLQGFMDDGPGGVPQKYILNAPWDGYDSLTRNATAVADGIMFGRRRADGWLEVELGEFYNKDGYDGKVSISLMETKGGVWKSGLIIRGIEIRNKQAC